MEYHPVILFDGVCHLCQGAVQFVIRRDPGAHFRFASLQSPWAQQQLRKHAIDPQQLNTIILLEGNRVYTHSEAILRILGQLQRPTRWLVVFRILPRVLRDALYRWIARNRYRWFGCYAICPLDQFEKERFVDEEKEL